MRCVRERGDEEREGGEREGGTGREERDRGREGNWKKLGSFGYEVGLTVSNWA